MSMHIVAFAQVNLYAFYVLCVWKFIKLALMLLGDIDILCVKVVVVPYMYG